MNQITRLLRFLFVGEPRGFQPQRDGTTRPPLPAGEVVLDADAYARWIRAQRPDLRWFLALAAAEQEVLARMGDSYVQDLFENLCVSIGMAVADPALADAGMQAKAGGPGAEDNFVQQLALATARKLGATPAPTPARATPATFGGFAERQQQRAAASKQRQDSERSFLGGPPR